MIHSVLQRRGGGKALLGGIENKVHHKVTEYGHKLKFSNLYIFETRWCKQLMFQTIWSNKIHGLKYRISTTPGCKDVGVGK